jgi:endonuclease YncB( thermonuclease family)
VTFSYVLTVDHVHDGDTIYGVLDIGMGIYLGRPPKPLFGVRFYAINAPELNTDEGKACRDYLKTLVAPGDALRVESYAWDKYGWRIDGIPYLGELNLCEAMLRYGHGTVPYAS